MPNRSDSSTDLLPRERLCLLAGVERGRHRRWLDADLLPEKRLYGEVDLVRAAALDELSKVLKARTARRVWRQVGADLGLPGAYLEVVVRKADSHAVLVRAASELAPAIPRSEELTVVSLHDRIRIARERFTGYKRGNDRAAELDRHEVLAVPRQGGNP
jgi:hypothetical protein